VPFALSGSVFLQYLLGYNFKRRRVGRLTSPYSESPSRPASSWSFTLEEMLARKREERGAAFNREDLIQAIKDGARLRLRPKVMTVATTIASLLPIMWSDRAGAEVMKPLATPVIGGSISSLLHILIVTPVIFAWLREREIAPKRPIPALEGSRLTRGGAGVSTWGQPFVPVVLLLLILILILISPFW